MRLLTAFWRSEHGTTAIEYALIATVVSLSIIAGVTVIGTRLKNDYFQPVANNLS